MYEMLALEFQTEASDAPRRNPYRADNEVLINRPYHASMLFSTRRNRRKTFSRYMAPSTLEVPHRLDLIL